jgi:hypothetical protein
MLECLDWSLASRHSYYPTLAGHVLSVPCSSCIRFSFASNRPAQTLHCLSSPAPWLFHNPSLVKYQSLWRIRLVYSCRWRHCMRQYHGLLVRASLVRAIDPSVTSRDQGTCRTLACPKSFKTTKRLLEMKWKDAWTARSWITFCAAPPCRLQKATPLLFPVHHVGRCGDERSKGCRVWRPHSHRFKPICYASDSSA